MSPVKQLQNLRPFTLLLSFAASALGLYFAFKYLPFFILSSMGFESPLIRQFLHDNEILLQFLALALAQIFYKGSYQRAVPRPSEIKSFWTPVVQTEAVLWGAVFKAFCISSLGVALVLFLGVASIERPVLDIQALLLLAPTMLFQTLLLLCWLWTLEWVRSRWISFLFYEPRSPLAWRAAYIVWESFFYYQLLGGGENTIETVIVVLVSLLCASSVFLWFELDMRKNPAKMRELSLRRIFFQWGLVVSLAHIWGLGWGSYRALSVFRLFEGPLAIADRFALPDLVPTQIFFVFFFAFFINALLQRLLRRLTRSV